MTSPQVLIVSDGAEFVRQIMDYWKQEQDTPRLTVVSPEVWKQAHSMNCSLAIVGPVRSGGQHLPSPVLPFEASVCAIVDSGMLRSVRARHPEWLLIPEEPGWPESLLGLAREVLRRGAAEVRAQDAEKSGLAQKRFAVLGGSLVKAQPVLVDVLTSLVGNADLILLSDDPLSLEVTEQMRTIHSMALRLNGMLQQLFALAGETCDAEEKSQTETAVRRA